MLGQQSLRRSPFLLLFLALAVAPAHGQESDRRATLRVYLRGDAHLLIDGKVTKQVGPVRRFYSPPLEPGKSYHYTLECTYDRGGKIVTRTEIVHFRAGEDKRVDLRDPETPAEPPADKVDARATKNDVENEAKVKPEVPFVPTPQDVVDKMLELAGVKKDDVVYDLGCGDGRIVVTAAKKYGCKAVGFDIDPDRVKDSRANVTKNDVEKLVTIERRDIYKVDLKPASVVTLYLFPEVNVKLIPQLEKLKAGSRIVSHDFDMEGVKPKQTVTVTSKEDGRDHKIYLWETPLQKEKE
jgi:uncharacterized protein (TIGR03000 family)